MRWVIFSIQHALCLSLPLLRGDQQCSWLDVDVSLFTLHSAPQIVTLELSGSKPEPVKVSTAPPPKLPEVQRQKNKTLDWGGSQSGRKQNC